MGPFANFDTGPNAGQTPEDYSDLHTSANPYANSSPATDRTDSTSRGFSVDGISGPGSAAGPYFGNPPAVGANIYRDGAGMYTPGERQVADDLGAALSNVYEANLRKLASYDLDLPDTGTPADLNYDEGFGRSGTGRS
jgi:hypothetical protein